MIKDVANFNVLTDDIEKEKRLFLCNNCDKKTYIGPREICDACACPIDYVITYKFKICPMEKWEV